MKKLMMVVAMVISFALVTSVYAQNMKWDTALSAQELAKGKPFKFVGLEILSIDPKAETLSVKNPNTGKTAIARMGGAKYEGEYNGVADLKVGDKVTGEGVIVSGENWVTKIRKAAPMSVPRVGPKTD
jgi:hypothetical protein